MKSELIKTGDLTSELSITLESSDYQTDFEKELKKYKDKAHLKGFRKGKTPASAIKKMYGKSILAEVINQKIQEKLPEVINQNNLDILGSPITSDRQTEIDLNMEKFPDVTFIFDLGLAPAFDVIGANAQDIYTDYKVIVEESMIDEELDSIANKLGEQEDVDGPIELKDMVSLELTEKKNPALEREPFMNTITVMPESLTEEYLPKVLGQMVGFEFDVSILDLEKNSNEEKVKKYFLKDAPEDVSFEFKAIISSIKTLVKGELNEENLEKVFGDDSIKTVDDAREFLKKELEVYYAKQAT